jgi:hypothetical protein
MATVGEALHGRANLVCGRRRETETGGEEPHHADNHLKNRVVHNTNTSRFGPFGEAPRNRDRRRRTPTTPTTT